MVGASPGIACRQCGSRALDDLGAMPPATVFAGQTLRPAWDGGTLYRCRHCHLGFRHPVRTEAEYERLYQHASGQVWVSSGLRVDQRLVIDRIESGCAVGRVLDVGCYDGSLLAALGPGWLKCGVEASAAAAAVAREQGIDVVAARIRDLAAIAERFDVVCAVDVIEHVIDPRGFIATLAQLLRPGGSLIVSTGSLDAEAWQAAGGRYWYGSFPEHISFVSKAWAEAVAGELGLELVEAHRFAYGELDAPSLAKQRLRFRRKLARLRLGNRLRRWLPRTWAPTPRSLGQPGIFEDHVLLRFRPGGVTASTATPHKRPTDRTTQP